MKGKIISALLGLAMLAVATPAFAATISNVQFSNNDTATSGVGGSSVNGTFKLTVGVGEVVEWIRTTAGAQPFIDTSVGGNLGYQEGTYDVPFTTKLPPNTGTYDLNFQAAGIYGAVRSINAGDNVNAWQTSVGSLRVVADGSSASTPTTPAGIPADIWAKFLAWMSGSVGGTTPAPATGICAKLAGFSSLHIGSTGTRVKSLQRLLNTQGAGLPVTGYFGTMTDGAVGDVSDENSCN